MVNCLRGVILAVTLEYFFQRMDSSVLLHAFFHGFECFWELVVILLNEVNTLS
jgi:hypothetical protein